MVAVDVRLWDLGLDLGLGAVPSNMSRLLTVVAVATDSNVINLHGVQVMCRGGVWMWGWMMFRWLQSCKDRSGRAHCILTLEHSSNVGGMSFP